MVNKNLTAEEKQALINHYNSYERPTNEAIKFYFYRELNEIKDEALRKETLRVLCKAPTYIFYVPASLSGHHFGEKYKHHLGLLMHLKAVYYGIRLLFPSYNLDEKLLDSAQVCGLIHDLGKYGKNGEIQIVNPGGCITAEEDHGLWLSEWLIEKKFFKDRPEIINGVKRHLGKWALYQPNDDFSSLIAQADFLTSRIK